MIQAHRQETGTDLRDLSAARPGTGGRSSSRRWTGAAKDARAPEPQGAQDPLQGRQELGHLKQPDNDRDQGTDCGKYRVEPAGRRRHDQDADQPPDQRLAQGLRDLSGRGAAKPMEKPEHTEDDPD